MSISADQVVRYTTAIALPEIEFESAEASTTVDIPAGKAVVVVGSQLTEFAPAVDVSSRSAIADSLLLAQLAANKGAPANDVFAWYNKYTEVLMNLGWRLTNADFQAQALHSRDADVHEEIIPIVTALLGPQVAAVSLVVDILKGLRNMDKGQPWITLFDQNSSHASGAKFQISYVDMGADGNPAVSAAFFSIQAERSVTQVLFLKFSEQRAELRKASGDMSISASLLAAAGPAIGARVREFVGRFVSNVDI